MTGMGSLLAALGLFVGTHFLMSHPLRAPMVARLGSNGFQIVYSLVSLLSFGWLIIAYQASPDSVPLWAVGDGLWWIATLLMLIASILFAGSLFGNPALPRPDAKALAQAAPSGVLAITRHPMMWAFALWAVVHVLIAPMTNVIILCAGIAFLALAGSAGQDRKKAALMGADWQGWASRTSFMPFGRQVAGAAPWSSIWPGRTPLLLGVLIWLGATYGHVWFGIYGAGIWRWIWS